MTAFVMMLLGMVFTIPAHATSATPLDCGWAVGPHFVNRWNQNPAGYGCPLSDEYQVPGGTRQNFTNGQMAWSPGQGTNMIVSGWRYTYWDDSGQHIGINVIWGASNPYSYDDWLIDTSVDGADTTQDRECGCTPTAGSQSWGSTNGGLWQFVIEGCDISWTGTHTCRQGWTVPIYVWA